MVRQCADAGQVPGAQLHPVGEDHGGRGAPVPEHPLRQPQGVYRGHPGER